MTDFILAHTPKAQRKSKSLNNRHSVIVSDGQTVGPKNLCFKSKSCEKMKNIYKENLKSLFLKKNMSENVSLVSINKQRKMDPEKSIQELDEIQNNQKSISTIFQFSYQSLKTTSKLLQGVKFNNKQCMKLLPSFLNSPLPKSIAELEKVCLKIDQFLFALPKKLRMENWLNIKNYTKNQQLIDFELQTLEFINNALPNAYLWFNDPLKNLIISLPKDQHKKNVRRQCIRKQLLTYCDLRRLQIDGHQFSEKSGVDIADKQLSAQFQDQNSFLVRKLIKTRKISLFFPIKPHAKFSSFKTGNFQYKKQPIQPKQTFLTKIGSLVQKKSEYYENVLAENSELSVEDRTITRILQLVRKMYTSRNISNLFKATILTQLTTKYFIPQNIAVKGMHQLLQMKSPCFQTTQYLQTEQIISFIAHKYKEFAQQLKQQANSKTVV